MHQQINTIFIDLGDTFRVIRKDEAYKNAAKARIAELLGAQQDPADGAPAGQRVGQPVEGTAADTAPDDLGS